MTRDDWHEWRYLAQGKVSHALEPGRISHSSIAKCGMEPWLITGDWLGTGTQREYERAATLPKCKRCLRKIGGAW